MGSKKLSFCESTVCKRKMAWQGGGEVCELVVEKCMASHFVLNYPGPLDLGAPVPAQYHPDWCQSQRKSLGRHWRSQHGHVCPDSGKPSTWCEWGLAVHAESQSTAALPWQWKWIKWTIRVQTTINIYLFGLQKALSLFSVITSWLRIDNDEHDEKRILVGKPFM